MASLRERRAEFLTPRERPVPMRSPAFPSIERHGYAPPASGRVIGLIGTALVYAAMMAGFLLVTYSYVVPAKAPPALVVFDVQPPASPVETPPEEKEALKSVEKKTKQPEPRQVRPIEPPKVQIPPVTVPTQVATPKPADPGPKVPETAAPRTLPAPPAPQVASNAPDNWEGRVLAALNKHRRYPSGAVARHQQGIPYVRFVMDRNGKVLSSRLERSSGFPDLDREAVVLPKRAEPLPKPPDDKPGETLELVVPVQFFLRT